VSEAAVVTRRDASPRLRAAAWAAIGLLTLVGVASAVARAIWVDNLGEFVVPLRQGVFAALGATDEVNTPAELARIDENFARFPAVTRLHVIPGAVFLLLAPLQLVRGIRQRRPAWHRWSGRVLLVSGSIAAVTGLFFGVLHPIAGAPEGIVIAIIGAVFLGSAWKAWRAIRRRDVTTHRRWMLRAYAVMFGVPLTRVLGTPIDLVVTSFGLPITTGFVIDLALSWALALGVAEWWIRRRG
jgi:uncharacterized membrane protein